MRDWVWWVSSVSNITTSVVGVAANTFMIFVILKKTPTQLATFSIIFLNTAFCDLLACFTALLVRQRVIPTAVDLCYISNGPCTYFGPSVCFFMNGFMLHLFAHAIWGILFSFAYRYYILNHPPPKQSSVAVVIVLIYLPSFLQLVLYSLSASDSEQVKLVIEEKLGYNVSSECVSGHLNLDWKMDYVNAHMVLSTPTSFIGVLILRKLITSSVIVGVVNMSENTRRLHSQLIRVLTIQACLPMFFILGAIGYLLGQADICHHPLLESSFIFVAEPIPALNPFVLLYSIGPYRLWVQGALRDFRRSLFSKQNKTNVCTVSMTTAPVLTRL
ncbi:unnamed protein product [Haemonchus placei]|uniref:G_PROTEIN_RECEP_F1_2 domain-containing protein n=1 Tax=Haemonchus placei TaxID=6290 RepID=A0A0N4WPX6_HAEPC|nr:unnamed protein product [Haemonchus placei]